MSGVIEDYPERVVVVLRRRLLESWAMVRTALQARVENVEVRRVGNPTVFDHVEEGVEEVNGLHV